jgi:hypothetical protein
MHTLALGKSGWRLSNGVPLFDGEPGPTSFSPAQVGPVFGASWGSVHKQQDAHKLLENSSELVAVLLALEEHYDSSSFLKCSRECHVSFATFHCCNACRMACGRPLFFRCCTRNSLQSRRFFPLTCLCLLATLGLLIGVYLGLFPVHLLVLCRPFVRPLLPCPPISPCILREV